MILYIILAGEHPLYVKGEKREEFSAKLKNPIWNFPDDFSPLAKSLFLYLVKTNPLDRYTAKEALKHPWITRRPGDIPLSYVKEQAYDRAQQKLMNVRSCITIHYRFFRDCFFYHVTQTKLSLKTMRRK